MKGVEQWAISPCKDCKERHLGCHTGCKKYAEFKAKIEENKKKHKRINRLF